MIVSELHKFIFVAVPKTGTHAVRKVLRQQMGPKDMEQVRLFGEKAFPIPELARLQHGHLSLQQVRQYLRPEDFETFFKFAFVRNPFDRFVSYCAFMTRVEGHFERDPRGVMRHFIANPPTRHILFRPQRSFITDDGGTLLSNYVGRTEQMQDSFDSICERIGIPSQPLERVNSSRRRDYREYYDESLRDGVARLYAGDLELFGYEF